jgi:hypothetical protein
MLFTQDRTRTRLLFRSAWQKFVNEDTLEPLEKQIVDLLKDHPEYHPLLTASDDLLDHDFTAEDGSENPFLHLSLHLALREQVGTDRPAGIASITRSLLLKHGDGHTVEHLMIERLGLFLWEAQRQSRAPDEQAYLQSLRELL